MIRFLTLGTMLVALALFGCDKPEESKSAAETEQSESALDEAAEETGEMATDAAEKTKEMAAATAEKTEEMVDKAAEETEEALSPDTVVLEASFGDITFPHEMHSDAYDCTTCHGEGTPGLIGFEKDEAHDLCRGCHEEEGAGPSACNDCHER